MAQPTPTPPQEPADTDKGKPMPAGPPSSDTDKGKPMPAGDPND